jgi:hypothetical protein
MWAKVVDAVRQDALVFETDECTCVVGCAKLSVDNGKDQVTLCLTRGMTRSEIKATFPYLVGFVECAKDMDALKTRMRLGTMGRRADLLVLCV